MTNDFLWSNLDGIDLNNVYFQQDGGTCRTSDEIIVLLREKLSDRFTSGRDVLNWPLRSWTEYIIL